MKKLAIIIVSLLWLTQQGRCQQKTSYTNIGYLKLTDTVLTHNINAMVKKLEAENVEYKKYGYITLTVKDYLNGDTVLACLAMPSTSYLKDFSPEQAYPDYYSFIGKRLVVIKINSLRKFAQPVYSTNAKRSIQKLVNSQLENIDKKVFYDIHGKKVLGKDFFGYNTVWIDTGVTIYLLKGKPSVVERHY